MEWSLFTASVAAMTAAAVTVPAPLKAEAAAKKLLAPRPSIERPASAKPSLVERDILALYDGTREPAPAQTRIHKQLEMPLNHLGYRVSYHDIATGLPDPSTLGSYAAVVTWFGERVPDSGTYLNWATRIADRGTKFVILDFIGSALGPAELPGVNKLLSRIGVRAQSVWIPPDASPTIVAEDDRVLSPERHTAKSVPGFMVFDADARTATSHLTVSGTDVAGSKKIVRSDVVVTGPGGGFIQYGFGQIFDQSTQRLKWITDPIAFLAKALGRAADPWPAPDTTTLAGRRIFFSHIDGDGWNNISEFANDAGVRYSVAEVVRDRLIRKYSDLPVSIGLIACDASTRLGGNARATLVARDLFEMKNVEVASHTHSHPYAWNFFRNYSRADEIALHATRIGVAPTELARPGEALPLLRSGYSVSGPDMPRANFVEPFDLNREIAGALDAASALAPANKKARLYLWSGDTSPFEEAIAATRRAGVRNLNGGDSRFDSDYPSMSYVPPIGKPVGKERQIYAVNSNENTYTAGWSQSFGAQARVTETWANTDSPRRLKGMNVYYHMYAGQKPESLAAVDQLLSVGRNSPVIPIPASQYAAIADSFYKVEITRNGPASWTVYDRGDLDTLRFDGRASDSIDLGASSGVLGWRAHNSDLYVALDPADTKPLVVLKNASTRQHRPAPALVESRWQLSRLERRNCGFTARASGFGRGDMVWSGLYPGRYTITATSLETTLQKTVEADAADDGMLRLSLDADAVGGLDLDVVCEFVPPQKPVAETQQPLRSTKAATSTQQKKRSARLKAPAPQLAKTGKSIP